METRDRRSGVHGAGLPESRRPSRPGATPGGAGELRAQVDEADDAVGEDLVPGARPDHRHERHEQAAREQERGEVVVVPSPATRFIEGGAKRVSKTMVF